jgi:cobalamin biosynthesis Mg chelatase CobN
VLPKPKSLIEQLLADLGAEEDEDEGAISLSLRSSRAGRSHALLEAALPYLEGLEPHRVGAIRTALAQLSLFQQERVIMAMPVIQLAD